MSSIDQPADLILCTFIHKWQKKYSRNQHFHAPTSTHYREMFRVTAPPDSYDTSQNTPIFLVIFWTLIFKKKCWKTHHCGVHI